MQLSVIDTINTFDKLECNDTRSSGDIPTIQKVAIQGKLRNSRCVVVRHLLLPKLYFMLKIFFFTKNCFFAKKLYILLKSNFLPKFF